MWKLLGKHFLRLKWCFDVSENSNYTGCEFWKQQPQNKGWSQHKIWAVNYYKGNRDSSFNFPARHLNVFLQHLAPNLWIMVEAQALPKSHCYFCWQKHYGQSRFWGDTVWHTSTKIRYSKWAADLVFISFFIVIHHRDRNPNRLLLLTMSFPWKMWLLKISAVMFWCWMWNKRINEYSNKTKWKQHTNRLWTGEVNLT